MENNLSVLLEAQPQSQLSLLDKKNGQGANNAGGFNKFLSKIMAGTAKQSKVEANRASSPIDEKSPDSFIVQQEILSGAFLFAPFIPKNLPNIPCEENLISCDSETIQAGFGQQAISLKNLGHDVAEIMNGATDSEQSRSAVIPNRLIALPGNSPASQFPVLRPESRYANDTKEIAANNLQRTLPSDGERAFVGSVPTVPDNVLVDAAAKGLSGPNTSDLYRASATTNIVKRPFDNANEPTGVQASTDDTVLPRFAVSSDQLLLRPAAKQRSAIPEMTLDSIAQRTEGIAHTNSTITPFPAVLNASETQLIHFDTQGISKENYAQVLEGQFIETSQPGIDNMNTAEIESGGDSVPDSPAVVAKYRLGVVETAMTESKGRGNRLYSIAALAQNQPEVAETLLPESDADSSSYLITQSARYQPVEPNPRVVQVQIPDNFAEGQPTRLLSKAKTDNGNTIDFRNIVKDQALEPAQLVNNSEPNDSQSIVRHDFPLEVSTGLTESKQPVHQVKTQYPESNRAEIITQIVENARLLSRPGNTEMTIRLKPEHLGELSLKILVEKGGVSASFHTDNPEVRGIIESSISNLKQELTNQGLKVDYVGVFAGLEGDSSQNPRGYQPQPKPKNQLKRNIPDFSPVLEPVQLSSALKVTAIDYRA